MTTRQSALLALFLGSLGLAALSGCTVGNPDINAAKEAMEQQNYERALASVDSAIAGDSANAKAYAMKARILRQMADSTSPDAYARRYEQARQAEEKAIKYDSGRRSTVQSQRKLAYIDQLRKGADAFNEARRKKSRADYMKAAAFFGAAGATQPDSADPILNEAFARLQAARLKEEGTSDQEMTDVIPVLERYIEKDDRPSRSAYTILTQLYRQSGQTEKAIDLADTAIEDLSNRPTNFRVSGTNGIKYSGTIEVGGSSRSVGGTVPDRIKLPVSEGMVSGTFRKKEGGRRQTSGRLQVSLYLKGKEIASAQTTSLSDSLSISKDLTGRTPLAELQNQRLNALNKTGRTEEAIKAYRKQIERSPENATYRYNYGSLLLSADRYDEAAEQLKKAVEFDPDDPKKQYNLGASYLNKGVALQDSLVALRDSLTQRGQQPTDEERKMVKELDEQRRNLFKKAIPPLERARQLSGPEGRYRQNACSALFQAYVQTEQSEKAEEVKECAGQMGGSGQGNGDGSR
jgi:tetratricopeptide (TPR) repeat protein